MDLDVDRNGAGTLALAVSADAELRDVADDAGADPLEELAAAGRGLGGSWRVADTSDDEGGRTVRLSTRFDDPGDLERIVDELATALNTDEVALLEDLGVAVTDDQVAVHGAVGARPTRAVRDYGVTPRRAVRLLRRSEAFTYDVRVRLPGEVLESNAAGGSDDGPLRWSVAPGERVELRASSTRPGPPWLRAALGAGAGGMVAALVLWLLARRRRAD